MNMLSGLHGKNKMYSCHINDIMINYLIINVISTSMNNPAKY